jgi:hypothetical protein
MGTAWVLAAIAAAVAALVFGRADDDRAAPDERQHFGDDTREGLAPGSDSGADDTRPSAHAPTNAARLDWTA